MQYQNKKRIIRREENLRNKNPFWEKFLAWNGLVIAFSTIMAYVLVYCFNSGGFMYFDIDERLVKIPLDESILVILFLSLFLSGFFFYGRLIYRYLINSKVDKSDVSFYIFCGVVIIFAFTCYYITSSLFVFLAFCILILLSLCLFIYGRRIGKHIKKESFITNLGRKIFTKDDELRELPFYIVIFMTFVFSTLAIGKYVASTNVKYTVINNPQECVILVSNSEYFICASIDRKLKEIDPNYKVLYYKDNQNLTYKIESIGPLHIKPTPTPTPLVTATPIPVTPTPIPITVTPTP